MESAFLQKQNNFELNLVLKGVARIIKNSKSKASVVLTVLFLRFLTSILTIVNQNQQGPVSKMDDVWKLLNFMLPHKQILKFNGTVWRIILPLITFLHILLIVSPFVANLNKKKIELLKFLGFLLNIYQYLLFAPIVGLMIGYFATVSNLNFENIVLICLVVLNFGLAFIAFYFISFFFLNFELDSIDFFKRDSNREFPFLGFWLAFLFGLDALQVAGKFSLTIKSFICLAFGCCQIVHFCITLIFTFQIVTFCYGVGCFCYALMAFLNIISLISQFAVIKDCLPLCFLLIFIFSLINLHIFYKPFTLWLLRKNEMTESNFNYFIKKISLLLILKEDSVKNENLIKKLDALILVHFQICKNQSCVCASLNKNENDKKERSGKSKLNSWRSDDFFKNLVFDILNFSRNRFAQNLEIDFFKILVYKNILKNQFLTIIFCNKLMSTCSQLCQQQFKFFCKIILKDSKRFINKNDAKDTVNNFEASIEFEKHILQLKSSILTTINKSNIFWENLTAASLKLTEFKIVCNELYDLRKINKRLLKCLTELLPLSKELCLLDFYYRTYVSCDSTDLIELKSRLSILKNKEQIENSKSDFCNPFDSNACVIGVSFEEQYSDQITYATLNSSKVFNFKNKKFVGRNLDSLMPQIIGKIHNDAIQLFIETQTSCHLNKSAQLWGLTENKILFSLQGYVKIILSINEAIMMGHLKALSYKDLIVVEKNGEISNYGESLDEILGFQNNLNSDDLILSIFLFMPGLIPLFLPHFYSIPSFSIVDLTDEWYEKCVLYTYKSQRLLLSELSTQLKANRHSKEAYCKALYDFLSQLKFDQLDKVYMMKMNSSFYSFSKKTYELEFVELKIENLKRVKTGFTQSDFKNSLCFLSKLRFDHQLKYSISTYQNRVAKQTSLEKTKHIFTRLKTKENKTQVDFTVAKQNSLVDKKAFKSSLSKNDENDSKSKNSPSYFSNSNNLSSFGKNSTDKVSTISLSIMKFKKNLYSQRLKKFESLTVIYKLKKILDPSYNENRSKWFHFEFELYTFYNSIISPSVDLHIGFIIRRIASRFS